MIKPDMKPIDVLKAFLLMQDTKGVETNDWNSTRVWEEETNEEGTKLVLRKEQIGFSFDIDGRFEGIFNYKD